MKARTKKTKKVKLGDFPGFFEITKNCLFKEVKVPCVVRHETNLKDLMAFYKAGKYDLGFNKLYNKDKFGCAITDSDTGFKGGTFKECFEPRTDLKVYKEVEKDLANNKIHKKLAFSFDKLKARKRVRSAYDGDYDYDKKWDLEPFTRRADGLRTAKIIKLYVHLSFSAYVSAKNIDKYGGMIAAIIKLVERSGALVELYCVNTTQGIFDDNRKEVAYQLIKVKRPDEYIPVQKLLRVFSSVFFRRFIFAGMIACADAANKRVDSALGRPYKYGKVWQVDKDKVHIFSVPEISDQNKIVQRIIANIKNNNQ